MDARKIKRELKLQEWAEQVKAQQESGMTIQAWCKANNVPTSTFSIHQRKVREAVLDVNKDLSMANTAINMAHVQLMRSPQDNIQGNIHISFNGIDVAINSAASFEQTTRILEVLMNA